MGKNFGQVLNVSTSSTMEGGVYAQMQQTSLMLSVLHYNPNFTWWHTTVETYTAFAMYNIKTSFDGGSMRFGRPFDVQIPTTGDMLHHMFLLVELPGLRVCPPRQGDCGSSNRFPTEAQPGAKCQQSDTEAYQKAGSMQALFETDGMDAPQVSEGDEECSAPEMYAFWVNSIMMAIARLLEFNLGSTRCSQMYSETMYMMEEFTGRAGARLGPYIGKRDYVEDLIEDSKRKRILVLPLPWFFTRDSGSSLVVCALDNSPPSMTVHFRQLDDLVVQSHPGLVVNKSPASGGDALKPTDLEAAVDCQYALLGPAESQSYASKWFEQYVELDKFHSTEVNSCTPVIKINANGPVTFLSWAVRRQCARDANDWFNFSGIGGESPIVTASIKVNGSVRVPEREAAFYNFIQPYQHMPNTTDEFLFLYSFAIHPGVSTEPSGACAMGGTSDNQLCLTLQDRLADERPDVILIWRQMNSIVYRSNVATLLTEY